MSSWSHPGLHHFLLWLTPWFMSPSQDHLSFGWKAVVCSLYYRTFETAIATHSDEVEELFHVFLAYWPLTPFLSHFDSTQTLKMQPTMTSRHLAHQLEMLPLPSLTLISPAPTCLTMRASLRICPWRILGVTCPIVQSDVVSMKATTSTWNVPPLAVIL